MSMGRVYVSPSAVAVNGINTLNASDPTSGSTQGGYYIHWDSAGGITGHGWSSLEGYISQTGWPDVAASQGLNADFNGFLAYVATNPSNLDNVFGNWTTKGQYVINHPTWQYYGTPTLTDHCIEVL